VSSAPATVAGMFEPLPSKIVMPDPNGPPAQQRVATHTAELMVPPEQAWLMISDSAMLAAWYAFGGATVEPEPGGRFELSWQPGAVFQGRVELADAPERLVYRLPQEPGVDLTGTNSTRVELIVGPAEATGRSVITVTESGFGSLDDRYDAFEAFRSAQIAWIGAFGLLVQATGLPPTSPA